MAYAPTLTRPGPLGVRIAGLAFVPVRDGLWRVVSTSGAILGHIERLGDSAGDERLFSARLLRADGIHFLPLGDFWSAEEAAECFR